MVGRIFNRSVGNLKPTFYFVWPYICSSQVMAFMHYIYIILFCLWSFYRVDLLPLFLFLFSPYVCSLMSAMFYALLLVSYAWEVEALFDLPINALILVW